MHSLPTSEQQSPTWPARQSYSASATPDNDRISEVILPSLRFSMAALIAPMLTQLSRHEDSRWLTLICNRKQASDIGQWLKTTGVAINKLLLLSANSEEQCIRLGEKALSTGSSHTVIMWLNENEPLSLHNLEESACTGNSGGIIIRQRAS